MLRKTLLPLIFLQIAIGELKKIKQVEAFILKDFAGFIKSYIQQNMEIQLEATGLNSNGDEILQSMDNTIENGAKTMMDRIEKGGESKIKTPPNIMVFWQSIYQYGCYVWNRPIC